MAKKMMKKKFTIKFYRMDVCSDGKNTCMDKESLSLLKMINGNEKRMIIREKRSRYTRSNLFNKYYL